MSELPNLELLPNCTYHHAGFTPFRDLLQKLTFSFWPIAAVRNLVMSRSELLSVDSVDISHN